MPNQSSRRIITNRQLNFTLSPVDTHNKKEMPYSLPNYAIDGTWNQHQSIILDMLLDRIFMGFYSMYKTIPKSWRSPRVLDLTSKFFNGIISEANISYAQQSIIESYFEYKGEGEAEGLKRACANTLGVEQVDAKDFKIYVNECLNKDNGFLNYKDRMDSNFSQLYDDKQVKIVKQTFCFYS